MITSAFLSSAAGIVLSVLFEYVPGLHDKYNKLDNNRQKLIMLGLIVVVGGAVYGLSCAGWLALIFPGVNLPCTQQGAVTLVLDIIGCLVSNQATYLILPKID